jgi:hypothetical protein
VEQAVRGALAAIFGVGAGSVSSVGREAGASLSIRWAIDFPSAAPPCAAVRALSGDPQLIAAVRDAIPRKVVAVATQQGETTGCAHPKDSPSSAVGVLFAVVVPFGIATGVASALILAPRRGVRRRKDERARFKMHI